MRFLGKGSSVLLVHLLNFFWMYFGYILRYFLHFHLCSWCSSFTSEEAIFRRKVNVRSQWHFLDAAVMCCSHSSKEKRLSIHQVCQVLYKLSLEVMSALIALKYLAWPSIIDCIRRPFLLYWHFWWREGKLSGIHRDRWEWEKSLKKTTWAPKSPFQSPYLNSDVTWRPLDQGLWGHSQQCYSLELVWSWWAEISFCLIGLCRSGFVHR